MANPGDADERRRRREDPEPRRFGFAQRWESRRAERSASRMWSVLGLDLLLVLLIVAIAFFLVRFLEP